MNPFAISLSNFHSWENHFQKRALLLLQRETKASHTEACPRLRWDQSYFLESWDRERKKKVQKNKITKTITTTTKIQNRSSEEWEPRRVWVFAFLKIRVNLQIWGHKNVLGKMGTKNGVLGEPKWVLIKFIHMYTEAPDQPSTQTKQMLVHIFHFLEKPPRWWWWLWRWRWRRPWLERSTQESAWQASSWKLGNI